MQASLLDAAPAVAFGMLLPGTDALKKCLDCERQGSTMSMTAVETEKTEAEEEWEAGPSLLCA